MSLLCCALYSNTGQASQLAQRLAKPISKQANYRNDSLLILQWFNNEHINGQSNIMISTERIKLLDCTVTSAPLTTPETLSKKDEQKEKEMEANP